MIMPENTDLSALQIDERDFYDEFGTKPTNKFNKVGGGKIYLDNKLKPAESAEVGNQKFDLDFSDLDLDPFTSYSLFMVLRDRSGNLSIINSKQMITDTKPPLIKGLNVETIENKDTEVHLKFNSNEKGTVFYKVVEKYIWNTVTKKYELNSEFYDSNGKIKGIPGVSDSDKTDLEREKAFTAIGGVQSKPMEAGNNSISVGGLQPHKEYAILTAVKDTYGNFTVKELKSDLDENDIIQPAGDPMNREFYSDGTKPKIVDNLIYRNPDDTFKITFSEAIMRKYDSDFTQVSEITTATALSDLMTMTGANISDFEIVSYTVGSSTTSNSELIIKPKTGVTVSSTIEIKMKDTVVDQIVTNKGNQFNLDDFGKYIYRKLTTAIIRIDRYNDVSPGLSKNAKAIFDLVSTDTNFIANEQVKYYYLSYSMAIDNTHISTIKPADVIDAVMNPSAEVARLAHGKGTLPISQSRTDIEMVHPTGFVDNDWIVIVLEDRYGNLMKASGRIGYVAP